MTYRRAATRIRWAAVGAASALVLGFGGIHVVDATISSGTRAVFVAIDPCRLVDTRPAPSTVGARSTPIGPGETAAFTVHGSNGGCTISTEAEAIVANVTILEPTADSYMTIFAADAVLPNASSLNWTSGQQPTPNSVTVELSGDGKIKLFNERGTVNVIVDVVGYYENHAHDSSAREIVEVARPTNQPVLPAAQLTLANTTFTTTQSGRLFVQLAAGGNVDCAGNDLVYWWIEVDGVAVPSSVRTLGGGSGFNASGVINVSLIGTTDTVMPAGAYPVAIKGACHTGVETATTSTQEWNGYVTVLGNPSLSPN